MPACFCWHPEQSQLMCNAISDLVKRVSHHQSVEMKGFTSKDKEQFYMSFIKCHSGCQQKHAGMTKAVYNRDRGLNTCDCSIFLNCASAITSIFLF